MIRPVYDKKYEKSMWTILFGLFMGVFIISLILWNRLIRDRLPKEIIYECSTIIYIIVIFMVIYSLSMVIFYMYRIYKKLKGITRKPVYITKIYAYLKPRPLLTDILQFIINYIIHAPIFLCRFIYFNSSVKYKTYFLHFFYRLGILLYKYVFPIECNVLFRHLVYVIILVYIPRILTFSVFVYEIIIVRKLEYFYMCLVILLVPLLYLSIRRILLDMSYFELERLQHDYINILSQEKICELTDREKYTVTKRHPDMPDNIYQHAIGNFLYFNEILLIAVNSFKISEKYDMIVSLITYSLLFLGFANWLLILLRII